MRQRFFLCSLVLGQAFMIWSCSNAQDNPNQVEQSLKTQTQLWQQVYQAQVNPKQTISEAWYRDGVPIVAKTESTPDLLDAAIASALLYYSRNQGIFTPAVRQTDEQFIQNARDIATKLSTEARRYEESEVIKALLVLQRKRAERFRNQSQKLPNSSEGGYVARFVAQRRNGYRDFEVISLATKSVVFDYDFRVETLREVKPKLDSLQELLRTENAIPVIFSTSDFRAYTVAGYLRDKETNSDYLIVHDPSVSIHEVPPDTLVKGAGVLAEQLRIDLKRKPLVKIDDIGILNEETKVGPPPGVQILQVANLENMEVFVISRVYVNLDVVRALLSATK